MQTFPIIAAVIVSAAAIIGILLWRLKPQAAPNTDVLNRRIAEEVKRSEILQAKLEAKETALRIAEANEAAAKATAQSAKSETVAAEKRNDDARLESIARQVKLDDALQKAAVYQTQSANDRQQIDDLSHTIETALSELTAEKAAHVAAVTKLQSDDASASHFKVISKQILDKTLEDAKRGMEELATTLQKGSNVELEKHAEKIAQTMQPLQAKLLAYDEAVESLKKGTQENYGSLKSQLEELQKTERLLHGEAKALTFALSSSPKVKGKYGEMMLKQLVEFVGMQDKCHFETQASRETEEGRKIPDLVVSLPGGQKVIVNAKAVMDACVEAQKSENVDQRNLFLRKHCDNVRSRIADLSSKNYFADHQDAVEAVVLFLPAENLYATAMENDAELTEYAMAKNIILCGPNSLMLLLKVSNQLWRRASVEKEAQDIKKCGEDIYKSACLFVDTFAGIGKRIESLQKEYNSAVGTLEGSVIRSGKRMTKFDSVAGNEELAEIMPVSENVREFKTTTKQLAAITPSLPDLLVGDETAEFAFSAGDE